MLDSSEPTVMNVLIDQRKIESLVCRREKKKRKKEGYVRSHVEWGDEMLKEENNALRSQNPCAHQGQALVKSWWRKLAKIGEI